MKNTVYGLFQKTVKSNTDNIAIIENNRKITFGDLSEMVDMIADSFPKGIKSVGKQKGFSQEELANRLNVSRQTISKWEVGD